MKDWEEAFKNLGEKLKSLGETLDEKLEGLETKINDKVETYVLKFVDENQQKRREREAKKGDPAYEYRANGYVTKVWSDGTKTVTNITVDDGYEYKTEDDKKKKKGDKILGMLPFLDKESLHELTVKFLEGELEIDMAEALPFLSKEDISLLMRKVIENDCKPLNGLEFSEILPFADTKEINEAFKAQAKNGVINEELMHFVGGDCWHEIVMEYIENEDSTMDIDEIYPYLNEEDLKLLFKTYLSRHK